MNNGLTDNSEIGIRVTVPEEFIGMAIDELNRLGGLVKELSVGNVAVAIDALLPANELKNYTEYVARWTNGKGRASPV